MSVKESRYLGSIELDGGPGGGAMDTTVDFAGSPLAVRLEIDFPDNLNDGVVNDVDMVITELKSLHEMAVETISSGLRRSGAAPAQMFEVWEEQSPDREGETDEFLKGLKLTHLTILPDGGRWSPDRVVMKFALEDGSVKGEIKVRFLQPTGPELAPAPSGGYR